MGRGEADLFPTHRMSSSSSKSTLTCGGEEGSAHPWLILFCSRLTPRPFELTVSDFIVKSIIQKWKILFRHNMMQHSLCFALIRSDFMVKSIIWKWKILFVRTLCNTYFGWTPGQRAPLLLFGQRRDFSFCQFNHQSTLHCIYTALHQNHSFAKFYFSSL